MVELPANLFFNRLWPVRIRGPRGFGGICGGTECMRTHVADGCGLTGGSGSGCRCRTPYLARTDATDKAAANPLGSGQFSPGVRPSPGDERSGTVIMRRLSLE
jgi:hypothetical protein